MGLRDRQVIFAQDAAKLIQKAAELGFEVTLGEALRPIEMQELYVKQGKSQTMNSYHLKKLAIDLNLFKANQLCTTAQVKPLGDWWESLSEKHKWGGNWTGFKDSPHFELHE